LRTQTLREGRPREREFRCGLSNAGFEFVEDLFAAAFVCPDRLKPANGDGSSAVTLGKRQITNRRRFAIASAPTSKRIHGEVVFLELRKTMPTFDCRMFFETSLRQSAPALMSEDERNTFASGKTLFIQRRHSVA
jgi:hypothetical protein